VSGLIAHVVFVISVVVWGIRITHRNRGKEK
jgi:hypothetical protein